MIYLEGQGSDVGGLLTVFRYAVTTKVLWREELFRAEFTRARDPDSLKEVASGLQVGVVLVRTSVDLTARSTRELRASLWFARLRLDPPVYRLLNAVVWLVR